MLECPGCQTACAPSDSVTCRGCGLWWVRGTRHERWAPASDGDRAASVLRLEMREEVNLGCMSCLLFLALFGLASSATIWRYANVDVPWPQGLFGLFVSLPLGLLLGICSGAAVLQQLVHQLIPSRLEGTSVSLWLRIWHTWGGPLAGFKRTNTRVVRGDIEGVSFAIAQGGYSQLFIVHASGHQFYAGFSGDRRRAECYGTAILEWLARPPPHE